MTIDSRDENPKFDSVDGRDNQLAINITSTKSEWVSPQLNELGHLSFVVKGISYNPLDGLANLTP